MITRRSNMGCAYHNNYVGTDRRGVCHFRGSRALMNTLPRQLRSGCCNAKKPSKGGKQMMKKQTLDDRLDESLGMADGKESTKKQTFADRRDESMGEDLVMAGSGPPLTNAFAVAEKAPTVDSVSKVVSLEKPIPGSELKRQLQSASCGYTEGACCAGEETTQRPIGNCEIAVSPQLNKFCPLEGKMRGRGKSMLGNLLFKQVIPNLLGQLGIPRKVLQMQGVKNAISGILRKSTSTRSAIKQLSKFLTNFMVRGKFAQVLGKFPKSMKGMKGTGELVKKLTPKLEKGMIKLLKNEMSGSGFFSDFVKGFKKGFTQTAKLLKAPISLIASGLSGGPIAGTATSALIDAL